MGREIFRKLGIAFTLAIAVAPYVARAEVPRCSWSEFESEWRTRTEIEGRTGRCAESKHWADRVDCLLDEANELCGEIDGGTLPTRELRQAILLELQSGTVTETFHKGPCSERIPSKKLPYKNLRYMVGAYIKEILDQGQCTNTYPFKPGIHSDTYGVEYGMRMLVEQGNLTGCLLVLADAVKSEVLPYEPTRLRTLPDSAGNGTVSLCRYPY